MSGAGADTVDLLLVEPDPAEVDLTLRTLGRHGGGARVAVARNAGEALDFLLCQGPYSERSDSLPKAVFLELRLPGTSGLDLLSTLRRTTATATLPVVVLSSSAEPAEIARAYQLGANGFVIKPVVYHEFAETISRLGGYWLEANVVG